MDTSKNKTNENLKENNSFQEISESDSNIYDFLDNKLEKDTNGFSLGFSKNIIREIEAKQQRRFNVKIYSLIFILVLLSSPLFISFLNTEFISMLFSAFLQNKFVFAFLLVGVILVQFSERMIGSKKDLW